MPSVERDREVRRRKRRNAKLKKLRTRLVGLRDGKERDRLVAKMRKNYPNVPLPEK